MEWLNNLISSGLPPMLLAVVLGVMTAISPCHAATNFTAIGYISSELESRNRIFVNGLLFMLGRVLVYCSLGVVLVYTLREGASIFNIQKAVSQYGEMILPPFLLVVGLVLLLGDYIKLPDIMPSFKSESFNRTGWGALWLGVLFSVAFCPTSALLYFGMLIPMSAAATGGYLCLPLYALGAALPVMLTSWIVAYSVSSVGVFYNKLKSIERWMRFITGATFVVVGGIYLYNIFL